MRVMNSSVTIYESLRVSIKRLPNIICTLAMAYEFFHQMFERQ